MITRREFLKRGSLIVGGFIVAPSLLRIPPDVELEYQEITWHAVTGDTIDGFIVYDDRGSLVASYDYPVTPNGGDITVAGEFPPNSTIKMDTNGLLRYG